MSTSAVLGDQSIERALEKASSYHCGPCPTVAASVGCVSGLVLLKRKCDKQGLIPRPPFPEYNIIPLDQSTINIANMIP